VERVPSPVQTLNAVTLATADMAASTAFYTALGFDVRAGGERASFTTYAVGEGFLNVQLDPLHAPIAAIWGRAIFWVDDVDAMYARAIEHGYLPLTTPADASWGERYFHIHDPDGHELSFARPREL
jgi:catechol 2,3-dioxygenase-like lactoylglutathione lyase family enzyme